MKLNKQFFGWLGASALLLTTACTNNDSFNAEPQVSSQETVYGNGSNIVTLSLNAEGAVGTRAEGDVAHISDGSKADVFIFAIYKKDSNGVWKIAKEFQKEENRKFDVAGGGTVTLGEGQNALKVLRDEYPITLKLALDPEESYKIACWAQNSTISYFATQNLEAVKVNYAKSNPGMDPGMVNKASNGYNNDEFRDAFCASKEINQDKTTEVIMHRPFAQINVGTSGADYHNIMQGRIMLPHKRLLYSKVELKGVSKYIDVLADKILAKKGLKDRGIEDSATEDITFDYSLIPTYYTLNNIVPVAPEYVAYMEDPETDGVIRTPEQLEAAKAAYEEYQQYLNDLAEYESKLIYTPGEEFLKVKLNDDTAEGIIWGVTSDEPKWVNKEGAFFPYKQTYPTLKAWNENDMAIDPSTPEGLKEGDALYLTEEFKYMSMCYVLVPTTNAYENGEVIYKGSTLDNVTFYFAENQDGYDKMYDGTLYKAGTKLSVNNVPVNRNWRTNILAGLKDAEEPDPDDPTPDGPDDETSLVKSSKLCIHLCPIFTNETTGVNSWNNPDAITSWTNYDGEKGEFDFSTNFPTDDKSWHKYFETKDHE